LEGCWGRKWDCFSEFLAFALALGLEVDDVGSEKLSKLSRDFFEKWASKSP
jgi:hypothetical protein